MDWILVLLSGLGGYLLGSVPTGYLIGRLHKVDVRRFGSGRTGGTNVLRVLGWVPALVTAAVDILKGVAAVSLSKLIGAPAAGHALAAFCAVVGHNYTFTLKFKGGAGVATMLGASAMLSFLPVAVAFPVGIGTMALTRYASAGSLVLATLVPLGIAVQWWRGAAPPVYFAASLLISVIIVWAHRPNIRRLIAGTERKIGQRAAADPPRPAPIRCEPIPPGGGPQG